MNNLSTYERDHLNLSDSFIAVDSSFHEIDKSAFFKKLSTGDYLPLRLTTGDTSKVYQLYKVVFQSGSFISAHLKSLGMMYYNHYLMEGKTLPRFNFVDVSGVAYNAANTKGKIVVLKLWFLNCLPCLEEIPDLNKLVEKNNSRKDIIFLSLAYDSEKRLRDFKAKQVFRYAMISVKESYIEDELQVDSYPTHIIIDKRGKVFKVVNNAKELIYQLEKLKALKD